MGLGGIQEAGGVAVSRSQSPGLCENKVSVASPLDDDRRVDPTRIHLNFFLSQPPGHHRPLGLLCVGYRQHIHSMAHKRVGDNPQQQGATPKS
jgi:hypothetical protein